MDRRAQAHFLALIEKPDVVLDVIRKAASAVPSP